MLGQICTSVHAFLICVVHFSLCEMLKNKLKFFNIVGFLLSSVLVYQSQPFHLFPSCK